MGPVTVRLFNTQRWKRRSCQSAIEWKEKKKSYQTTMSCKGLNRSSNLEQQIIHLDRIVQAVLIVSFLFLVSIVQCNSTEIYYECFFLHFHFSQQLFVVTEQQFVCVCICILQTYVHAQTTTSYCHIVSVVKQKYPVH